MKVASVKDVLNNFLTVGYEKGIFEAFQIHALQPSQRGLSFSPPIKLGMIENGGISPDEYIALLDDGRYSAVFDDGSIVYLECIFDDDLLVDHRYFFIPCPFDAKTISDRPKHIAMADWFRDSLALEPRSCIRSRGVFRFDCDRVAPQSRALHPVSHLTFVSGECRMPVRGPLQISTFFNFMFDNFFRDYRPIWWSFSSYLNLDDREITITAEEQQSHHIHWESRE